MNESQIIQCTLIFLVASFIFRMVVNYRGTGSLWLSCKCNYSTVRKVGAKQALLNFYRADDFLPIDQRVHMVQVYQSQEWNISGKTGLISTTLQDMVTLQTEDVFCMVEAGLFSWYGMVLKTLISYS